MVNELIIQLYNIEQLNQKTKRVHNRKSEKYKIFALKD